jgi:hypothetical protein
MFIFGSEVYEDEEIIFGRTSNQIEETEEYDDMYSMLSIQFQNKYDMRTTTY